MPYDILILGGGPAGLSAAINARARGRSALVVSNAVEEIPLWKAERVDNYPGMPGVTGAELLQSMRDHAESMGTAFVTGRALNAAFMMNRWYVSIGSEMEEAAAVVLASGVSRGKKFPGEEAFLGRGVSYCATCDGMLYRGKSVAVLGYSDSARKEAAFLEEIGCAVHYFDRPKRCSIAGEETVRSVTCDGETVEVACVFLLRPTLAPTDLFPGLGVENGYVSVDTKMATSLPGVFAAGDCTGGALQVAKAVGEGLIAGQSAAAYAAAQIREAKNK